MFPGTLFVAGKNEIMAHFDKAKVGQNGFLMQLGTLSGNPVASIAGLKTMEILRRNGSYKKLREIGKKLMNGASELLNSRGLAHRIVGDPALFDILFTARDVLNYRDTLGADSEKSNMFNKVLRKNGIFKAGAKLYPCLALDNDDVEKTIIALILVQWAYYARAARASALVEKNKEYVEAAHCLALGNKRIILSHIAPNCMAPLIVVGTLQTAHAISLEATLSFLGLGLPITEPSLGLLIGNGFEYMYSGDFWISIFPGVALLITIVSINLVGDQLRDMFNPRLQK